jgi:outer membrane protein assembly factor BamB
VAFFRLFITRSRPTIVEDFPMTRIALAIAALAGCWCVLAQAPTPPTAKPGKAGETEKTDITAQVKDMNSSKFASPPTEFRTGHVKPRQLDAKAIHVEERGFTITLPSGAPIPTPTVYKGKLYISGGFHSKEYYCCDAQTGKVIWGVDLDDDGPTSAVCEDDVVIFNTESCTIFALDANTGKHLWSYFLGDPLTSTPTISSGKVYTSYPAAGRGQAPKAPQKKAALQQQEVKTPVNQDQAGVGAGKQPPPGATHVLVCFELKTGAILWQRWIDSDVMSAPVAIDDELYATSFAGTVYKFRQSDGAILSAQRSNATSAPVIVGKNVYLTQRADRAAGGKVAERIAGLGRDNAQLNFEGAAKDAQYLDAKVQAKSSLKVLGGTLDAGNGFAGGAPAAANPTAALSNVGQGNVSTMQAFQGSRLLNFDGANFNCMGDEVVCTDPKDGTTRWSVKLQGDLAKQGGHLAAPPAAAGGSLFLTTLEGNVIQMEPEKGTVQTTWKVGSPIRSQPAIEGGRIYVGTQNGRVICINAGDAKLTGWSTWGGNAAHTNVVAPAK